MRVESPEPTEADSQDGEPVAQMNVQSSVSETMVAWHQTELIVDAEPTKCGVPDGDVHMPLMAGEGDEKTEVISVQDSVIHEAWCGWEDSLRMAHRMRQVTAAALQNRPRGEPSERVTRLTPKEGENLKKWKEHFVKNGFSDPTKEQ